MSDYIKVCLSKPSKEIYSEFKCHCCGGSYEYDTMAIEGILCCACDDLLNEGYVQNLEQYFIDYKEEDDDDLPKNYCLLDIYYLERKINWFRGYLYLMEKGEI